MRFSLQPRVEPKRVSAASNLKFFRELSKECNAERGRAAILLVGARDLRSVSVRRAQAHLRYDRRSSYFSHAALIARWKPSAPQESVGFEASLDPEVTALPVPERNGVTQFRLERYLDEALYPNLALISLELKAGQRPAKGGKFSAISGAARKERLIDAARNPCRERESYALWDGLATWAKYRYNPERSTNPLFDNIPLPAAAYCEYVYAAEQIDIVPAATGRQACPEMLWATFLRWQEGLLATSVEAIDIHMVIRDEHGTAPEPLPMEIPLPT